MHHIINNSKIVFDNESLIKKNPNSIHTKIKTNYILHSKILKDRFDFGCKNKTHRSLHFNIVFIEDFLIIAIKNTSSNEATCKKLINQLNSKDFF